jgi:L,D-transpeptidase-like protein
MHHVITRNAIVTAGALLLALAPVRSAFASDAASAQIPTPAAAGMVDAVAEAAGAAVEVAGSAAIIAEAASLRPGGFVWRPEEAQAGAVEIVVSIPLQRAYVYRGGTLIAVTTVSTGRQGHATPTGRFDILEKRREHYSNLYNNAPMPFMQRLTWDGIALHAGEIPGRPASHGCVRLPLAFARHLFGVTQVGASVHIVDHSPSALEALALVRGGAANTGMGGPEEPLPGAAG